MFRPLRIQYPNAWYHVMNRGSRGEAIFSQKADCSVFIDLLKEVVDVYNVGIVDRDVGSKATYELGSCLES
jgi:hypothetical protein